MIMKKELPEIVPLEGLRLKIQYRGVTKLCSGCYGEHLRKTCKEKKLTWFDYIKKFRNENQDIPDDFYGDVIERANRKKKLTEPKPEDFSLPRNKSEWEAMLSKMKECGIEEEKVVEMMKERKGKFEKAYEAYTKKPQKSNVEQQN